MRAMAKGSRKAQRVLAELRALLPRLQREFGVQSLEIFGSVARGEDTALSDLDLLVTFQEPPTLFQLVELEHFLSDQLGIRVDLVLKEDLKPDLRERILREARRV